jgi:hypothetical protein
MAWKSQKTNLNNVENKFEKFFKKKGGSSESDKTSEQQPSRPPMTVHVNKIYESKLMLDVEPEYGSNNNYQNKRYDNSQGGSNNNYQNKRYDNSQGGSNNNYQNKRYDNSQGGSNDNYQNKRYDDRPTNNYQNKQYDDRPTNNYQNDNYQNRPNRQNDNYQNRPNRQNDNYQNRPNRQNDHYQNKRPSVPIEFNKIDIEIEKIEAELNSTKYISQKIKQELINQLDKLKSDKKNAYPELQATTPSKISINKVWSNMPSTIKNSIGVDAANKKTQDLAEKIKSDKKNELYEKHNESDYEGDDFFDDDDDFYDDDL